jgi:hypothetical protein
MSRKAARKDETPRPVDLSGFFERNRDLMRKREEFTRTAELPPNDEDLPHCENWVSKSKITQAIANRAKQREQDPRPGPIWDGDGRMLDDLSSNPPRSVHSEAASDTLPSSRAPPGDPSFVGRPPRGTLSTSEREETLSIDKAVFHAFLERQDQLSKAKQNVKHPKPKIGPCSCRGSLILQKKLEREQRSRSPLKDRAENPTFRADTSATRRFRAPVGLSVTEIEGYINCREADRAARNIEAHVHDTDGCTFQPENPRAARRERLAQRSKARPPRKLSPRPDSEEEELRKIAKARERRAQYLKSQEKRKRGPFRIAFEREHFAEVDVPQRTIKPW